jgi:hypothetical protein
MASFLLAPPYQFWTAPTGRCDLGAVLFHDLDGTIASVAEAADSQRGCPWCPPCVRIAAGADSSVVELVYETGSLPGIVPGGSSRCLTRPDAILTALERRRPPSVPTIAGYVVRRLGCHALRDALIDAMSHRNEPTHARTVRRRLAGLGRWRPWEWHRIAGMALTGARADLTLDRLAAQADTEPRSLRRWLRELLGVDAGAFRQWPGWEWIVEAGLRRGGYLAAGVRAREPVEGSGDDGTTDLPAAETAAVLAS